MRPQRPSGRYAIVLAIGSLSVLAIAPAAQAQMSGNNILYTPAVDVIGLPENTSAGNYGGVFLTTYSTWPSVNWLGYYDMNGDGLANSHQVALWYTGGAGGSTASKVAEVTIPAGTAAPLIDGYRWVQLSKPVGLWYGSWYTISALTDGVDTFLDLLSGSQLSWDPEYVGTNAGWSRAGRYDTTASWPNSPKNQVGSDAIYPVANIAYNIPEPASAGLLALASMLMGARRQRRGR